MKKLIKRAKRLSQAAVATAGMVAINAHAAVDGTIFDGPMADIAIVGGLMLTATVAVTGYAYMKRTAR